MSEHKWKIELAKGLIVSVVTGSFVAGVIWATINNRISDLEDKNSPTGSAFTSLKDLTHDHVSEMRDMPNRKEFDALVKEVENLPHRPDIRAVQDALSRIETKLETTSGRLRKLELDVAVIAAGYSLPKENRISPTYEYPPSD